MSSRTRFANLKKLLFHEEPEAVWQGVALAGALADPRVHDRLLENVQIKNVRGTPRIYVGKPWPKTRAHQELKQAAVLGLWANCPDGSAHRSVRDRLEHLGFQAPVGFDCSVLAAFPRLRKLRIDGGVLERPEQLAELPALHSLSCSGRIEGELRLPPTLRYLEAVGVDPRRLDAPLRGLVLRKAPSGDIRLPELEQLHLELRHRAPLRGRMPALHSLRLSGAHNRTLPELPALQRLSLRHCERLEDLGANRVDVLRIQRCPKLTSLDLPTRRLELESLPQGLVHLDRLPKETILPNPLHLSLHGRGSLRSIRGVGALREVKLLDLRGCSALETLDGIEELPALWQLDLRGCSALLDLGALKGSRARIVLGHGSPVTKRDLPEGAALSLALRPDLARLQRHAR